MAILKALKYKFMFKLSASLKSKVQLIQLTDQQKGTKKVTSAIYRPDEKKVKNVLESLN